MVQVLQTVYLPAQIGQEPKLAKEPQCGMPKPHPPLTARIAGWSLVKNRKDDLWTLPLVMRGRTKNRAMAR
jgi:hypothetical protein